MNVTCSHCRKSFEAPGSYAGRQVKCVRCGLTCRAQCEPPPATPDPNRPGAPVPDWIQSVEDAAEPGPPRRVTALHTLGLLIAIFGGFVGLGSEDVAAAMVALVGGIGLIAMGAVINCLRRIEYYLADTDRDTD